MNPGSTTDRLPLREYICDYLERDAYSDFLEHLSESGGEEAYISFTFPIPGIDPLACLELLDEPGQFSYFWENPRDDLSISAGGQLLRLQAEGQGRFDEIRRKLSGVRQRLFEYSAISHSRAGIRFLGGFSFFDRVKSAAWSSFGAASFTLPEWLIVKEGQLTLLTLGFRTQGDTDTAYLDRKLRQRLAEITDVLELDSARETSCEGHFSASANYSSSCEAREHWMQSVQRARELIAQGAFQKIVLAREARVELDKALQPSCIAHALRTHYPSCYTFLIRPSGGPAFVGSSPERLAAIRRNYLLTEALAGSIRRGENATGDALLEKELLQSAKNADEHSYVVRDIEQRLAPFTSRIDVGPQPVIKKLSNVQHLCTPITAWLKEGAGSLQMVQQLHPTPAVGGYPWKAAAPYIERMEQFDRGWYAGPVGWLKSSGEGEFAVAIRSGLINEKQARFYAGCGIVADSDPEAEWRETELKLVPMLSTIACS